MRERRLGKTGYVVSEIGLGCWQLGESFGPVNDETAAEILNLVGSAQEAPLIAQIAKADEALSQKLQDLMFVFEDLLEVDDRGMQELLREVPGDKLIIALKAADETLKQKFFKNMSERAAQMMKDDLEARGPVRLSEVETAQKEILIVARRMAEWRPGYRLAGAESRFDFEQMVLYSVRLERCQAAVESLRRSERRRAETFSVRTASSKRWRRASSITAVTADRAPTSCGVWGTSPL